MLLFLFTVVPFVELYLLLWVSEQIGFGETVLVVVTTGMIGAALAKAEGLRVMRRWQTSLAEGRVPEEGVVHGAIVLVGGVLLVTPGVLTDIVGLLLLIPPTRRWIAYAVKMRLAKRFRESGVHVVGFRASEPDPGASAGSPFASDPRSPWSRPPPGSRGPAPSRPDVIDAEGHTVESDEAEDDGTVRRQLERYS